MSRVAEAETQRNAFYTTLRKIRVKSVRQMLELYYMSYVEPIEGYQLRRDSKRLPRVLPGLNAVMGFLGCNKSTAMDYLYALDVIENHMVQSRLRFHSREKAAFSKPGDVWSRELKPER